MKIVRKSLLLLAIGLIVSILIYPTTHELGHYIVAKSVDADVIQIKILPTPYVICNIINLDTKKQIAIGLGGIFLPPLLSLITIRKWFITWYANLIFKVIILLSFFLTILSSVAYAVEKPMIQDDITRIITLWPNGLWFILIAMAIFIPFIIWLIAKERPFNRCLKYFD